MGGEGAARTIPAIREGAERDREVETWRSATATKRVPREPVSNYARGRAEGKSQGVQEGKERGERAAATEEAERKREKQ